MPVHVVVSGHFYFKYYLDKEQDVTTKHPARHGASSTMKLEWFVHIRTILVTYRYPRFK